MEPIFQTHKNTYEGGLNTDIDPKKMAPSTYIDASDVTLTSNGVFYALRNIAGTSLLTTILPTNYTVLGAFACRWNLLGVPNMPCIVVFAAQSGGNFQILLYDTTNILVYTLYSTPLPSDYFSGDTGTVDAVLYPEKGQDILYFTDNYYEPRKIICNLPVGYNFTTQPLLTDTTMAVARRRAVGSVIFVSTAVGGNLLTGTYQFAYQLINLNNQSPNANNKYTKFSLLTNPVHIYTDVPQNQFVVGTYAPYSRRAGVGLKSNYLINLNIQLTDDEVANYTHFRVAAVENIGPEGTKALEATLTEIQPLSQYLVGNVVTGYQFKNNYGINTVTLDEIIIDSAAISHVKTLTIKDNRLICGNITYKNLTYNNGSPVISGGQILRKSAYAASAHNTWGSIKQQATGYTWDSFASQDFSSQYRGYFRGELYRFAISYFDKYGNYSYPVALNMGTITNNMATSGFSGVNLFSNSSFSSGLTNWNQTGALGTSPVAWGVYGGGGVFSTTSTTLYTNVLYQPATQGLPYTLTGNWNVSVFNISYRFGAVCLNSSLGVIGTYYGAMIFSGGTQTQNITFTSPAGTAYVGVVFYANTTAFNLYNLTSVVLSSNFLDMQFPQRSDSSAAKTNTNYTLFDETNLTTQSLGLRLSNIVNHPTWAVGFVILRARRQKDILFQSPLVPMMNIYALGPLDNYPTISKEGVSASNVTYSTTSGGNGIQATPPGPVNVLYPMNYGWCTKISITKQNNDATGGLNAFRAGEAKMVYDPVINNAVVFPPSTMFTQNYPYVYSGGHIISTVDAFVYKPQALQLGETYTASNNITTWKPGSGDTTVSLNLVPSGVGSIYYDPINSTGPGKAYLRATTSATSISGFLPFSTGSAGSVLNGKFVLTLDNLETKGVSFGFKPTVQKCCVIELASPFNELSTLSPKPIFQNPFVYTSQIPPPTGIPSDIVYNAPPNNIVEIVNVISGLTNTRYGSPVAVQEFISTGTQYNFTTAQIAQVALGISVPVTVDVWGGDCFVASVTYKLTDSAYSLVNSGKIIGSGLGSQNIIDAWGRAWVNLANNMCLSMPVAMRNFAQYLTVVIESEFNTAIRDIDTGVVAIGADPIYVTNTAPFNAATNESQFRTPLTYAYNFNLSQQNDQKIFISKDPLVPVLTTLKSRLVYSNVKIYNSLTDGFDTIPVGNFYDLPEMYGAVTKLAIEGNNVYSIQESGIAYLPIGNKILETTSAASIQVHTGDIINTPFWVNIKRGSQHIGWVKETGNSIYIVDANNKAVYNLAERGLTVISDNGAATLFRNLFTNTTYSPVNSRAVYDFVKKEFWVANNSSTTTPFCYVYNEPLNKWVSNYSFTSKNVGYGVYTANNLYLVGQGQNAESGLVSMYTMYSGNTGYLMGTTYTPYVTFAVNPNSDFGKTFDSVLINSTDRLLTLNVSVNRESALGTQISQPINLLNGTLSGTRGEGNYRVKTLRDQNNARLRGLYATATVSWSTTPVALTSVLTQWRPSFKQF